MSKKSREQLKANMYEDYDELIYSTSEEITKTNKVVKQKQKAPTKQSTVFGTPISDTSVACKCNKCNGQVYGTLIGSIYSPSSELETPFISYECPSCKHSGHRSVQTKAVSPQEFDRIYF